jgi:hypothetical protein
MRRLGYGYVRSERACGVYDKVTYQIYLPGPAHGFLQHLSHFRLPSQSKSRYVASVKHWKFGPLALEGIALDRGASAF